MESSASFSNPFVFFVSFVVKQMDNFSRTYHRATLFRQITKTLSRNGIGDRGQEGGRNGSVVTVQFPSANPLVFFVSFVVKQMDNFNVAGPPKRAMQCASNE